MWSEVSLVQQSPRGGTLMPGIARTGANRSREFRPRHTKRQASGGKLEAGSETVVALTCLMPCSPSSRRFRAALEGSSIDALNACWRWRVAVQALEATVNTPPLFYCAPLFVVGTTTGQLVVSKGRASLTGDSDPSAPHDNIVTIDLAVITPCGVLAGQFDKRGGMWHLAYVAFCSSLSVSAPSITVDKALSVIKEPHLMRHLLSNEDEIGLSARVESVSEGEGDIIQEANGGLDMGHGFEMASFLDDSAVDSTLTDLKANDEEVLQASVTKASSRRTIQDCRGYGRDGDEGRHRLAMLASNRKSPHVSVIEAANSSSGTKWALSGTFMDELGSKHQDGFSSWSFPCRREAGDHCQSVSPEPEESNDPRGIRGGWDEAVKKRINLPEGTVIKGSEDGQDKAGILRSILKTAERRAPSLRAKLHVHWCEDLVDEDPAVKAKREMLAGRWLRSRRGRRVRSPLCSPVGNRPRAFTMDLEDAAIK